MPSPPCTATPCAAPLIALGVLSAQSNLPRRLGIRQSWGRYEDVQSGRVLLRFVIGVTGDEVGSTIEALRVEAAENPDVQLLNVRITGRKLGPMHTTFAWLQHSTSTLPCSSAAYVAKLDDDCYINVPELVQHLTLLQHLPMVYYGIFYYSTWLHTGYRHFASGYDPRALKWQGGECMRSGNCSSPFPFAAAPAQVLSIDLAAAIAASPLAYDYTTSSLDILSDPKQNASSTFASEDVWIGYAIHDLLPSSVGGVTVASLHRFAYTFDSWGAEIRNTTVLFHNKMKDAPRVKSAYYYMRANACPTNVSISCTKTAKEANGPVERYSQWCSLQPNNASCNVVRRDVRKTTWGQCQYYPLSRISEDPYLSRFCLGQRDNYSEADIRVPRGSML